MHHRAFFGSQVRSRQKTFRISGHGFIQVITVVGGHFCPFLDCRPLLAKYCYIDSFLGFLRRLKTPAHLPKKLGRLTQMQRPFSSKKGCIGHVRLHNVIKNFFNNLDLNWQLLKYGSYLDPKLTT